MASWAEIAATTISDHIKGAEPVIMRNRAFTAMLFEKGRIKKNCSGKDMTYRFRYNRKQGQALADAQALEASRTVRHVVGTWDWKTFAIADVVTKLDTLKNRGKEAIVQMVGDNVESLVEDIKEGFDPELLCDASSSTDRVDGINTIFQFSGTAGKVGTNTGTYGGLSLVRGAKGGSWGTGTWPYGIGDESYDYLSPVIWDYSNSGWSATTWASNADEVLRAAMTAQLRNKMADEKLDCFMLDTGMYEDLKNLLATKERIAVGDPNSTLTKLGFENIHFEGVPVVPSYGLPYSNSYPTGYGFCFKKMELRSLQSTIFYPEGPQWDIQKRTYVTTVDFMGNLLVKSPRCQQKFAKVS